MTRITETKSVKVDNWGVFFLQKLQNFFNKTDHCDLTLQFNDNSQLKVHRLVLSACTDYFNMLESTCEMYDDVLIMPLDLQADVIVPIVNFMYTGTLEFQYGIYEKLLKTAKDMNMTVLLKLLEAHKQTTRIGQNVGGRQPVLLNKQAPGAGTAARGRTPATSFHSAPQRSYGAVRGVGPRAGVQGQKPGVTMVRHQTTIAPVTPYRSQQVPEAHALVSKYGAAKGGGGGKGPTRFDESAVPETLEGNFDDITYESTPLVTADQIKKEEETSPFEKLRKGYTNVGAKRPAPVSFSTPVAKKPNLQEVKEFTEAARLRSQLAADDEDSPGFADDTHFDDDEEEDGGQGQQQQQLPVAKPLPTKASPGLKQIVIKQEPKTSPGGGGGVKQITVKDESGSVDHAKIISEVLKKYPHLVKKNKNIKLKIMQKTSPQAAASNAAPAKMEVRTATPLKADISMVRKATDAIRQPAATTAASAPAATSTPASSGPKKIDSKTMHALIAKGAENMTGPWLCLRCGIDGRPISIPSYKAFRNHLIVKHKEKIDARICEHCGWRAEQRNPNLFYHWLTDHNIKSTIKFPTCAECGHVAMNASLLAKHEEENHQRGDLQQCIYCNKVFAKEMDLYDHMKALHKDKAREDGVIDFSDDEYQLEDSTEPQPNTSTESSQKIKILSNISITNQAGLPFVIDTSNAQTVSQIGGSRLQQITLEPSSEAEALSNVASGIATSLGLVSDGGVVIEDGTFQHHQGGAQYIEHQMATVHGETGTTTTITAAAATGPDQLTKLITEDGTELQLTQSQKEEIFSQLQNSGNGGNVVMVLNDDQFITGATGLQLEDGTELINAAASGTTTDSNIVVMYSQAGDELTSTQTTVTTTAAASSGGGKKSDAKDVAEDETSQASTQPSEKEVSEKGEDDTSQMEVDPESSQDRVDEEEEEDEEEAARLAKEEEEKAAKEKEKLKLISELEGDWSEDTEEQPTEEAVEEKPKQVEVPKEKEKAPPSSSKTKEEAKTDATEEVTNEKEIDRLLDEWHNEVKADDAEPEPADAELEKKLKKVVGEEKTEEKSTEKQEEPAEEEEPVKEEEESEEPAAPAAVEPPAEQTPDVSVDEASSLNDSESTTQVVMVVAAESETETSTREDETSQQEVAVEEDTSEKQVVDQEEEEEKKDSKKEEEKEEPEAKDNGADAPGKEDDEDEAAEKEPEEDKTKSKEVVNSLLGDWDEDDDL